jgi:predicted ArsR family transcriptional regulator
MTMKTIFKISDSERLFKDGKKLTTDQLANARFFSTTVARRHVKALLAERKLIIVDYAQANWRGKPSPAYAWRTDLLQKDVAPATKGMTTGQRTIHARERARQKLAEERREALERARTDAQRKRVNADFDEKLTDLVSERAEAQRRYKKQNSDYNNRKQKLRRGTFVSPTSLLGCWNPTL